MSVERDALGLGVKKLEGTSSNAAAQIEGPPPPPKLLA